MLNEYLRIFPILIILFALISNLSAFLIFRLNKEMKKIPSMVYLSFIVIVDFIGLFTWNLDYFLDSYFQFLIEHVNLFTCRFFVFIQYFSEICSAFLMCLVSIDRYKSIIKMPGTKHEQFYFGTTKSAFVWSSLICISIALINSHFLFLNGFYNPPIHMNETISTFLNGTEINITMETQFKVPGVNCFFYVSKKFEITSIWKYVQFILYCVIPGGIAVVFNILLVVKTTNYKKYTKMNPSLLKCFKRKKRITFSLLVISFAFILMTFPATIYFDFIYDSMKDDMTKATNIGAVLNFISFANNSSVFFNCFITNLKFRKIVLNFIYRHKIKLKVKLK